ncbi:hypothetical protein ACGFYY_00480, partial [Streptomyces sp. NPDC048331]|uniref:hypothetical protein n=1 Tax=Streptomyces sp. NPDC048331 TaxID=3365534 RepID=UPI0037208A21
RWWPRAAVARRIDYNPGGGVYAGRGALGRGGARPPRGGRAAGRTRTRARTPAPPNPRTQ